MSNPALGTRIIVDAAGFTVYHLTSERPGTISCRGSCRGEWPPLLVAGPARLSVGPGLSADRVGTIKRPDGGLQVTYAGEALHLYRADVRPGEVNGQAAGGLWFALTPAGAVTRAEPHASPDTVPSERTVSTAAPSAPVATTPAAAAPADSVGCAPGEVVPQGGDDGNPEAGTGNDDDDNAGGPDDGDGCL